MANTQKLWARYDQNMRLADELLRDGMPWITRRIEKVHILDMENTLRNVSLDIDLNKLYAIAKNSGLRKSFAIPIPLGYLDKGLAFDFSVSIGGDPLSLWTSNEDSKLAQAAILSTLPSDKKSHFTERLINHIYKICYLSPVDQNQGIASTIQESVIAAPVDATFSEQRIWRECLEIPDFYDRLSLFSTSYMPVVELSQSKDNFRKSHDVLKYELRTAASIWPRSRSGLHGTVDLITPLRFSFRGEAEMQREHLQIFLPDDIEMADLPIFVSSGGSDEFIKDVASKSLVAVRRDAAAIYRSNVDQFKSKKPHAKYSLVIGFIPKIRGFMRGALASIALSSVFPILILLNFCLKVNLFGFLTDTSLTVVLSLIGFVIQIALIYSAIPSNASSFRTFILQNIRRIMIISGVFGFSGAVFCIFTVYHPCHWISFCAGLVVLLVQIIALFILGKCHHKTVKYRNEFNFKIGKTVRPGII